jgi:hypothetical protein
MNATNSSMSGNDSTSGASGSSADTTGSHSQGAGTSH